MTSNSQYLRIKTEEEDANTGHSSSLEGTWRRRFWTFAVFSISLLLISWAILFWVVNRSDGVYNHDIRLPYSPATAHLRHVNRYMTQDPDTPRFMGKPRPELDQAWHDLLQGTLIKYTAKELLDAGNATSVAHKDGGFVGGLGISHSLHCLKRLKQYFHRDYYYSHEGQDWHELESHADHCLESLRQTLLCQADVSVYTLEWTPHSRVKPTVRVPQAHACVDWTRLHGWMLERAAKLEDMVPADPSLYENTEESSG